MSKQTENYIGSQQHWEDRINDDYDYLKQMEKELQKQIEKQIYNNLQKRNTMVLTPKEKAEELVLRYLRIDNNTKEWFNLHIAKQCALIAVNEILNSSPLEPNFADWDDCGGEDRYFYDAQKTHAFHFWQEVKKEIEKL